MLIVSAHPYCARKFTRQVMHRAHLTMIGQMAIAINLPRFNVLGRSVTPIFLLVDRFLYRFSTFSEKNEENLSIRSLTCFAKCTIEFRFFYFFVSLHAAVSNAS